MYVMNLSRYAPSICQGLLNVVRDTKTFLTMTPQPTRKHLGVGASCTVKLRFLHPKNQVKDKIPNQSLSQQLTGLIVQSKAEKIIRKVNKDCIVFRHEEFGRQLVWALQRYFQVDIQGLEQSFFEEETQEPPTAPGEGTNQHNEPSQATDPANADAASNTIPNNAEELRPLIQEMLDRGGNNLDNDDIINVMAAAPMIDDDNQPAPENLLSTEDSTRATDDIMGQQWTHSGICDRKATIQRNAKPELTFWILLLSNPSNLKLVRRDVLLILHQNNNPSPNQPRPSPWRETHLIWGIPTLDWFVDANGDYRRSPEARVLGNQPNRRISWGPSSSERLDDSNSIRGHPLSAYLHRQCFPNLRQQILGSTANG